MFFEGLVILLILERIEERRRLALEMEIQGVVSMDDSSERTEYSGTNRRGAGDRSTASIFNVMSFDGDDAVLFGAKHIAQRTLRTAFKNVHSEHDQ